ncbi:MAG: hypothetical protein R3281_09190 [Balneolaceae bacterium]|nr:hypothetical protein [Balneolaceae bacterium]
MKTLTILTYQWEDLIRGKWVLVYGLIYLLLTDALFRFGGGGSRALMSVTNVMLLFVPLVALVYGVLFLYQSREFVEMMLAQPLKRSSLFWGLFGGITMPLSAAFVLGAGLPLLYNGVAYDAGWQPVLLILGLGWVLTVLFTGIGFLFGLCYFNDRIKGFGLALVSWLFLAVLYDGFIMLVISLFGEFPLERVVLGLSLLNPIDLARVLVLLEFDISALMGYTGAVFSRFFGSGLGMGLASACLVLWVGLPVWAGNRLFLRKDF